jgi:DNA-binding MarR family transcriptional regulator
MTRRSEQRAAKIADEERAEPLRRRILQELSERMRTTRELASALDTRAESVSRIVSELRDDGLLESGRDPSDRRKRPHLLTARGEVELSRHYAYGQPRHEMTEPSYRQRVEFLYSALEEAVRMRRETNLLEDAASRMSVVLREARKIGDGGLVIEALSELATTLRQIPTEDSQIQSLLDELEEISLGKSALASPSLVMPAIAHREYALGRLGENRDSEGDRRARHLIGASNLYSQLAAAPYHLVPEKWREREGWGRLALARNLRARSEFEESLEEAAQALITFREIGDPYGWVNCHYVFGDCLRLLGDFDGAWEWLRDARVVAKEHSYHRFEAELLMQIGEVLRCRGRLDEAAETLEESRDRAETMGLQATRAFAHSALGAVAFHRRDQQRAQLELGRADQGFKRLQHGQGLALNSRRRAAAARRRFEEERVDVEGAERMIALARRYYQALGSPAGVAACEVEKGRLEIVSCGDASETVDVLLDLIENRTPEKNLLELDPWVPGVMSAFAEETGVDTFIERAVKLREAATRRLSERARLGVQRAAQLMGRTDAPHGPASIGSPTADEMGGETRQVVDRNIELALA